MQRLCPFLRLESAPPPHKYVVKVSKGHIRTRFKAQGAGHKVKIFKPVSRYGIDLEPYALHLVPHFIEKICHNHSLFTFCFFPYL